jgi:hypothetical protein
MPDRVLFVRRWGTTLWFIGQLPINPRERFYPNLDFETSRRFWDDELCPCFSEKRMQRELDAFAKKYGLAVWEEET